MTSKKVTLCARIFGGLGNQLFIFAYAYALGLRNNCNVIFDSKTGFVRDNYGRKATLSKHIKHLKEANSWHILLFFFCKKMPILSYKLLKAKIFFEEDFRQLTNFNQDIIDKCSVAFIQGYFQSPTYFSDFSKEVRKKIQLSFFKSDKVLSLSQQITETNSVSIHVRRVQYDNLLEIDYYQNAINLLCKKINKPEFFVFSDDIAWCEENFKQIKGQFNYIMHDVEDEAADLWLMSQCSHHIIANSSFSWWGAFLSDDLANITIAPKSTQIGVISNFYPINWIEL